MVQRKQNMARLLFFCGLALGLSLSGLGQAHAPVTMTTPSGEVAIPAASGSMGRKDAAALTELTEHLTAVGPDAWHGMQAQGKITFGASGGTSYPATFTTEGRERFRLDAQTKTGTMSVRIQGHLGKTKNDDDAPSLIPSDTAALGLFPFALPRLLKPDHLEASLIDHGMVTMGGMQLHRLTYETAGMGHNPKSGSRTAVDLYFDPTTHLLAASAASGMMPDSRAVDFLFVTTYGDYRKVGATMVPFQLSETVNGEPYRSLQLSDVQLNPTLDSKYFVF